VKEPGAFGTGSSRRDADDRHGTKLRVRSLLRGRPLLARPAPSAEDRFLALPARSWSRPLRPAKGRFYPFAKPSTNGRFLRIAVAMVSAANVRFPANAAQARRLGLTLIGLLVDPRAA
jgi:hypothetical protein